MNDGTVAVFDLDHTITRRDSLLPLLWRLDSTRCSLGILRSTPFLALSRGDRNRRDEAKATMLRSVLQGRSVTEVDVAAETYADEIVSNGLNPAVHGALQQHLETDHRVVIASASPRFIVEPLARLLGVSMVVCTELDSRAGRYSGRLAGPNMRSLAKRDAVLRLLSRPPEFAYGNLPDDLPLLEIAAEAWVVHRGEPKRLDVASP